MLTGIDVSNNNGRVDWHAVAAGGAAFAFLKATEGTGFVDHTYDGHRAAAAAAGLRVGAYHFARPGQSGADAQAAFFLAHAAPRPGDLLPVLDLEDSGGLRTADLQRWVLGFLGSVEHAIGAPPVLYTSPGFWRGWVGNFDAARYPLWLADYASTADVPGAWRSYVVWQHSGSGAHPGVAGQCDLDRCETQADLDGLTLGTVQPAWPELREGARAPEVVVLKRALRRWYAANPRLKRPPFTIDSVYGPKAVAAVKAFQKASGLEPDGDVGPLTWGALTAAFPDLRHPRHPA